MGTHEAQTPVTAVTHAAIKADAWDRAGRTLWQGIGIDAGVAIGLGATVLLEAGDVTTPLFWGTLGVLVIKSILTSVASYLTRLKLAPKAE